MSAENPEWAQKIIDDFRDAVPEPWTHIGGDLEARYDGFRYVDIRTRDGGTVAGWTRTRLFVSKDALLKAVALFPPERDQ